jgi:hypothetical protein
VAIPEAEWLHFAKRAPINGQGRHHHNRERSAALVVKNLPDRYTAYCMRCKEGAVLMKEHVRVTGIAAPATSADLTMPSDMVALINCEQAVRDGVLGFLAHKNMDMQYILDLHPHFSKQRMRLLLSWPGGWLGRDTTERSPQKWLTFNKQKYMASGQKYPTALVVEDPFSFCKVRWALRGMPFTVYSSLGTGVHDALMLLLLEHDLVGFFYDGDPAGYKGADVSAHRVRAMGVKCVSMCAPAQHDPKDLTVEAIQQWVVNMPR